ncbi:MAG: type III secretion system chaperone [Victivallales bacterium]|nr:type III secretion system chaperone [Victivallales bacterium]
MDFTELVSDFAKRHDVEGLAAMDGKAYLDIDGITVTLVEDSGYLIATAEIGDPPPEGRNNFAEILLEANLESAAYFAKTRESGKYVLVHRIALMDMDSDSFDAVLEALLNSAETWRDLLEDYRPVAAQSADEDAESPAFATGGFMPVESCFGV